MNILKRKHRLKSLRKESKDFARVGWILDYGLRFREEEGVGGREKKTTEDDIEKEPRIELAKDEEGLIELTRDAPNEKS